MKTYTKVAFTSRGLHWLYDILFCSRCGKVAVDIHHIFGRLGNLLNDKFGLIPLCRECHDRIHAHNTLENKQALALMVKKEIK